MATSNLDSISAEVPRLPLFNGLPSSSTSGSSGQSMNRVKTYKVSTEDVLHFLSSGRQLPPSFSDLDKVECKRRLHTLSKFSRKFVYETGTLYYLTNLKGQDLPPKKVKVLISRKEIEQVLADIHGKGTMGTHMGEKRTQSNITERFYWRTITEDVKHWIATCPECQKTQKIKTMVPELKPIYAKQPWEIVGIDLIGPLKTTAMGHKFVLTGTCSFSKWVEAEPIMEKSAECVFHGLMKWIHRWGAPLKILSDQGKEFNKKLNQLILDKFNIRHLVTAAYPQTNGQDEKTNGTLKCHLSKVVNEQQNDWHLYIEQACWDLRSSYNESTKHTPYMVMHIRKPRFPSELPQEDEPIPMKLEEPTPNDVANYISSKQQELAILEKEVTANNETAKEKQKKSYQMKRKKGFKAFDFHVGVKQNK